MYIVNLNKVDDLPVMALINIIKELTCNVQDIMLRHYIFYLTHLTEHDCEVLFQSLVWMCVI